jgi:hypothetical protein
MPLLGKIAVARGDPERDEELVQWHVVHARISLRIRYRFESDTSLERYSARRTAVPIQRGSPEQRFKRVLTPINISSKLPDTDRL